MTIVVKDTYIYINCGDVISNLIQNCFNYKKTFNLNAPINFIVCAVKVKSIIELRLLIAAVVYYRNYYNVRII